MRYQSTVILEAIQWEGDNQAEIDEWLGFDTEESDDPDTLIVYKFLLPLGDWIIREGGSLSRCSNELFEKTFKTIEL